METNTSKSSIQGQGKDQNGTTEETHYYFYQAADGQNVFLQPLAFRCLLKEYGTLANLPPKVDGQIEFMEEISVSESSRKRWKKIVGQLPLGTAFSFCDIDISSLVSETTRKSFANELNWRKGKWEKKKKERGEGAVQGRQQPPRPKTPEIDYSSLPEEVLMALSEAEKEELMRVHQEKGSDVATDIKEKEKETEGKKEKEEPGSAKSDGASAPSASTKAQQRKSSKGSAPVQSQKKNPKPETTEAGTSPSVPSFLQVLKNTAPVPINPTKNENGEDKTGKGGKRKKGEKQLFSNNSTRRY